MTETPPFFPWLLLQRLPGAKPALLRRLLAADPECTDPLTWLAWSPSRLRALGAQRELLAAVAEWRARGSACAAARQALRDGDWLARHGVQLLPLNDPRYPPLLLEIADPPPLLYVRGDPDLLSAPQIAVVGSRRPSRQGSADAGNFAAALAGAGFTVTSGLALGIDAAAHRAALERSGRTIAVLGCGIDVVYPAANGDLAAGIGRRGALISEFPLGTPPRARQFPSRNRIISGLSLGVLVIEAAIRSGSLVTARLAAEQNREVFALPGSIHNPVSRGCNALIRQGGTLVQSVDDMLVELSGWLGGDMAPAAAPSTPVPDLGTEVAHLSAEATQVLAAIGFEPVSLDEILAGVAQSLPTLLAALAELELAGLIENRGGTYLRAATTCAG